MVAALDGTTDAVSFESTTKPGFYLRHRDLSLYLDELAKDDYMKSDASFHLRRNCFPDSIEFESTNIAGHYISLSGKNEAQLGIEPVGNGEEWCRDVSFEPKLVWDDEESLYSQLDVDSVKIRGSLWLQKLENKIWHIDMILC